MIWLLAADIAPPGIVSALGVGKALGWLAAMLTVLAGLLAFLVPRAWAAFQGWTISDPQSAAFIRTGGAVLLGLGLLTLFALKRFRPAEVMLLVLFLAWGFQMIARGVSRIAERGLPPASARGIAFETAMVAMTALALAERWDL